MAIKKLFNAAPGQFSLMIKSRKITRCTKLVVLVFQ